MAIHTKTLRMFKDTERTFELRTVETPKAFVYNGSSNYTNLNGLSVKGASQISISFWVKTPANVAQYFFDSFSPRFIIGQAAGGTPRIDVYTDGWINVGLTISANVWQHITLTFDGSKVYGYLNGEFKGSGNFAFSSLGATTALGSRYSMDSYYTSGSIAHFQIYNHVLASHEIYALYRFPGTMLSGALANYDANEQTTASIATVNGFRDNSMYAQHGRAYNTVTVSNSGITTPKWKIQDNATETEAMLVSSYDINASTSNLFSGDEFRNVAKNKVTYIPPTNLTVDLDPNIYNPKIGGINFGTWNVGSGSTTGFTANQSVSTENQRFYGTNPFGKTAIIWEARPDAVSGADGGWNTSTFTVDTAYTYRFSTWIRRTVLGDGSYYFGCYGYNSTPSNIGVLLRSDGTTVNTNPYFRSNSGNEILSTTSWFLIVGHVWALGSGAGAVHTDTGLYTAAGSKIATPIDFIWYTGTAYAVHRSYLYYSTNTATRQQWWHPRVDKLDGTQPTISNLLNNAPYSITDKSPANNTLQVTGIQSADSSNLGSFPFLGYNDREINLGSVNYTNAISFNIWIKIGSTNTGYGTIISRWGSGGNSFWIGTKPNDPASVEVYFNGSLRFTFTNLALNTWQLLTVTSSTTACTGYVNAVQTNTGASSLVSSTGVTGIGYDINRGLYPFVGNIGKSLFTTKC